MPRQMLHNCLLYSLLMLSYASVFAQNATRVYLKDKVEDDKLKKTQAIIPVYKYVSQDIEPYSSFGVIETKKSRWIRIQKLADMTGCRDTGYSFIYFSGANNELNEGYIITLIGNYNRSRQPVQFFVDRNNNLDFSDDGAPLILPFGQDSVVVTLSNPGMPQSVYEVKLSRIVFGKNLAYKDLLNEHYMKRSGSKVFTKINNCYREQRYNLCSGEYKSKTDSFTISIKDNNVNALYNDEGMDKIFIGPYQQPLITEDPIEYQKGKSKSIFEWNEKQFVVTDIDPLGKWVDIAENTSVSRTKKLKKHRKVPKFSFMTEMNQKYHLKSFRRKQVYLYFWNDDLACLEEDTIYLRKIQVEFGHKIQVIGMNYGDEPKSMRFFQQYYNIPWLIGMSTREINKKYYVENLPKAYWIGKRRRLKERNLTPKAMYEKAVRSFGRS